MPMVLSSAFPIVVARVSCALNRTCHSLFADEWPRSSFAIWRKGKPASFRLFSVGSYTVVGAGSDTFWLVESNTLVAAIMRPAQSRHLPRILWLRICSVQEAHLVDRRVRLAEFWLRPRPTLLDELAKIMAHRLSQLLGEPEDLVEFFCQRLSSLSLAPCHRFNPRMRLSVPGTRVLQSAGSRTRTSKSG
jgi:hypothetical protein